MVEVVVKEELKLDSKFLANAVVRLMKRDILEKFMKSDEISKEDQEFCDRIDWDPIDELEVREEYIEKLKKVEKEPHSRMTLEKLDTLLDLK